MLKKSDRNSLLIPFMLAVLAASGCAHISETAQSIWGSSTKALEDARPQAFSKTFQCQVKECFDKALDVAKGKKLEIFMEDRRKQLVVLMKIPGSINTTEVGVFFSDAGVDQTRVEVASLSLGAKEKASELIFEGLKEVFRVIE